MKERLDKLLVLKGLVSTRSQADNLIKSGLVICNGVIDKKSGSIYESENIDIVINKSEQYVGRGGDKLEHALKFFSVNPNGLHCIDVGASTGGFTDVLLKNGAAHVYAIDVGHDQLAESLRNDKRVSNFEGINVKYPLEEVEKFFVKKPSLAVVDLSYISLKLVLNNIVNVLEKNGKIIALVKPQFEVGRGNLSKNGIVKDDSKRLEALIDIYRWSKQNGLLLINACRSPILGKSGNIEYLFYYDLLGISAIGSECKTLSSCHPSFDEGMLSSL